MKQLQTIAKRTISAILLVCLLLTMYSISAFAEDGNRKVVQDSDGRWVCMKNGKIETSYTGIAHNQYGWWRIKKGVVDFDATGVCQNEYGWFYVRDGRVDWDYTGFAHNQYGWWYIRNGEVNWTANGVYQKGDDWYYVRCGSIDFGYTGLASNQYGNWYVKKGKVDFNKNGSYSKGGVDYTIKGGKVQGNGKLIYLTFDDGPGAYTNQLLGVLEKYGVKATFFVTNCYPNYQNSIKKEYKSGHVVAAHTYSHQYSSIYRSTGAFWNDHEKIQSVIKKQTGNRTDMFRFPGGSSNTVSRRYSKGVMTSLTKQANAKKLAYYDWNVDSDDAGKTKTANGVFNNITRGVRNQKTSLVLCHDIKPYTVEAMDRTIKWCLQNGYTFVVCQPDGYTYHMRVAN